MAHNHGRLEVDYQRATTTSSSFHRTQLEADFCIPALHASIGDTASHAPPVAIDVDLRDTAAPRPAPSVEGVVLLVEDSLVIAMDAEDILTGLGAERVVTASGVAQPQSVQQMLIAYPPMRSHRREYHRCIVEATTSYYCKPDRHTLQILYADEFEHWLDRSLQRSSCG